MYLDTFHTICGEVNINGFSKDDIVSITTAKSPAERNSDSIILQFNSEAAKINLYTQRTSFRHYKDKFYLNEVLTKVDASTFKKARDDVKCKKITLCLDPGRSCLGQAE